MYISLYVVRTVGIVLISAVLPDSHASASSSPPLPSCLILFAGVSILELVLILAMKHLREVHSGEPLNFEMVFDGMCVRACM